MRKYFAIILSALMIFTMSACGNSNVDVEALSGRLSSELTYADSLYEVSADFVDNYIDLEADTTAVMYMGSGITADQFAIFTCKDAATAQLQEEHVKAFVEDQRASFANYIPEQAARLENCVLIRKGRYVVLCVSENSDLAKSIINSAL